MQLRNRGAKADSFLVLGDGDSPDFKVRYFIGGQHQDDVTDRVTNGRYRIINLPRHGTRILRVEITPHPEAAIGAIKICSIITMPSRQRSRIEEVQAIVVVRPPKQIEHRIGE